ncbi:sugar ABC transporter ATP-binding protein [Cellulomonas sp. JH27-2]|nr:sugar ABC transporter ATP-binding protein [Cellulomonas sp. JH27-2]
MPEPAEGVRPTPVISLRGVSRSFGAARAVQGIDLDVHAHEVVAVVGDTGAGKSTLVGLLSGALQPDEGSVLVDGAAVTLADPAAARALGIVGVFQDLALCANLDVVQNLFLGQESIRGGLLDEVVMEKEAWRVLGQLAARVPSLRVPVAALSGAQRRSVAIARALLGEPRVILLDEPTASLGLTQVAEFLTLVERLRERGHAVLITSHSLTDVQAVADRIVVLRLGRTNGEFDADRVTYEDLLAAMTGVAR